MSNFNGIGAASGGAPSRELRIPSYKRRDRRLAHADQERIRHRQDVLINHQKPN